MIGRLAAEVDKLVLEYFPQSTEWVELKPAQTISDVVSIAAGNVLVGPELCRRDEWINGAKRYVGAAITAAWTLRQWPWFLRPFVYLRMPEMQGLKRTTQAMEDALQPVVEERQRKAQVPGWEQNKPDDFLQWYMDSPMEWDLPLAEVMLGVGLVALNSSGSATTNAYVHPMLQSQGGTDPAFGSIYDLAARPEYQDPIRTEVKAALAKNNGVLTKDALYQCTILDSFLKESQRMNPEVFSKSKKHLEETFFVALVSAHDRDKSADYTPAFGKRVLLKDFRLSDGTVIPKGTFVCCPIEAVTHDPAHYENPDEFDGYRHYRLRQQGGFAGEKHQWISTNQATLSFGYGKHSCPGRFFATIEIKLIFAFIMLNYDLAMPEGQERPRNIVKGERVGVSLSAFC